MLDSNVFDKFLRLAIFIFISFLLNIISNLKAYYNSDHNIESRKGFFNQHIFKTLSDSKER